MKLSIKTWILVATVLLLNFATKISAQTTTKLAADKIVFIDGSVKEGKVLAFQHDKVHLTYSNETVRYEFNKADIERVEYSSGRVEIINSKKTDSS